MYLKKARIFNKDSYLTELACKEGYRVGNRNEEVWENFPSRAWNPEDFEYFQCGGDIYWNSAFSGILPGEQKRGSNKAR